MNQNAVFEQQLLDALADFAPTLAVEKGSYRINAMFDSKQVAIVWPYPLAEVFLDFSVPDGVIFSEWVEYYDGESDAEQILDIARTVRNFLLHEIRVVKIDRLLKRSELQFQQAGTWSSVF